MERQTEETVTTKESDVDVVEKRPLKNEASGSLTVERLVYFIFGVLEILLVFRFVLKLLGASLSSGFVSSIYDISRIFVWPFEGIFSNSTTQGAEATSVFEPATLVAIVVYALVAWGIVMLVRILSGQRNDY